jgi:hypothetical protein
MRGRLSKCIRDSAATLRRLHARVHETLARRDESPERWREWEEACEDFLTRWDWLAFPGGYALGLQRLKAGEPNAVEAALCFLECRPYFFRSGYMYAKLMKLMKRTELTEAQDERFDAVLVRDDLWRLRRLHGPQSAQVADFYAFLKRIGYDPPAL